MEIRSFQKKSRPSSARSEKSSKSPGSEPKDSASPACDGEEYMDRSMGQVARVSSARGEAECEMGSFGHVSEYEVTIIEGRAKDPPPDPLQSALDFPREALRRSKKEL